MSFVGCAVVSRGRSRRPGGEGGAFGVDADAFGGRHLHGLKLDELLTLEVAGGRSHHSADEDDDEAEAGDQTPDPSPARRPRRCRSAERGPSTRNVPATKVPATSIRGGDDVRAPGEDRVGDDGEEAADSVELGSARFRVEGAPTGCCIQELAPRIRGRRSRCRWR